MVWLLNFRGKKAISFMSIVLFLLCLCANKIAKEASLHISLELIKLSALNQFRFIIAGVLLALHKDEAEKALRNTSIIIPVFLIGLIFIPHYVTPSKSLSFVLDALSSFSYPFLIMWFISNPEKCSLLSDYSDESVPVIPVKVYHF